MQTVPSQFGRYTVRSVLAQTALSTVYEAWDERIGRRVAVKAMSIIDRGDFEGQELVARFARGAKAAGQLNHRNIVQVYDYAEQDDVVYLVMEFIEGRTLKTELDGSGAMDPSGIVAIMDQVLLGLGYSHARGVVHRDMKPANILLTDKGEAKITDFGIARMERSDLTQPGMFIGTPSYMSPEQFRGDPIDFRTDIYSVGVILYQMLTARRPYEGGLATIMHKVLNTEPPPPSSFGSKALAVFDPVVRRAMAKRPQDRFASASELAEAIGAAADATAVRVTSAASRPVAAPPTVKHPTVQPTRVQRPTVPPPRVKPATVTPTVPISPAAAPRTTQRTRRVAAWQLYAIAGGLFVAASTVGLVRSLSQSPTPLAPPVTMAALPARPVAAQTPPSPTYTTALADSPVQTVNPSALPVQTVNPSALPIQSVNPPALPAQLMNPAASPEVPPQRRPALPRRPPQRIASASPAVRPADADSLRSVLMRLSHQPSDATPHAGDAAARLLPSDHARTDAMPSDQGTVDDGALSVLWYAASSSPIGLLLQGNAPGGGSAHPRGLSVIGVLAGSPAERAGCRAGDLILAVDNRPVTDPAIFDRLRTGRFHGGSANLRIMRDGKMKTVSIATQPASPQ
jgi:serine/threonine protein kinase